MVTINNYLTLKRHFKMDYVLLKEAINIDKEIMHGTPVFKNTRVPVQTLFDYLEESSLEEAHLFDIFIAVDKNLPFQQNKKNLPVLIIILNVGGNAKATFVTLHHFDKTHDKRLSW